MEPIPTSTRDAETETTTEPAPAFSRSIDWAIGGVLGLLGLLMALGGWVLYAAIDRQGIATVIREGEFRSDVLTEAEAIDVLVAIAEWGGLGLAAVGVLLVLFGVAVVWGHGRARRHGRGTPNWVLGVVGAIVSTVLSFVPFSPLLGGAAASCLSTDRADSGVAAGTFAGIFTTIPALVGLGFVGVGLFSALPEATAGGAVLALAVGIAFTIVYVIGLSAIGGYAGRRFAS